LQQRLYRIQQENNLKTLLNLLLFKIKELQKKFIALKVKKQLTSQILSQICAKKD